MPVKPIVILVHGMGQHKKGDMKKEFIETMNKHLAQTQRFKDDKIEKELDIVEYNYSDTLDSIREMLAKNAEATEAHIDAVGGIAGASGGNIMKLALKFNQLDMSFREDEFFNTHWLDVILYTTLLGEMIRMDASKFISECIINSYENNEYRPVHIIAHSLGTAVMHDTLAKLYQGDYSSSDGIADLSPVTHRINSLWQLANVSRSLNIVTGITTGVPNPYSSLVNPSREDGCVSNMYSVRHRLDPIPHILPFDRSTDDWGESYYPISTSNLADINNPPVDGGDLSTRSINPHDFTQYLSNPDVAVPMINTLLGPLPQADRDSISDFFESCTLSGALSQIQTSYEEASVKDISSIKELINEMSQFYKRVEAVKDQLSELAG